MVRWVRTIALGVLLLAVVGLGLAIGLFLVANDSWVPLEVHSWLRWAFGDPRSEVWVPALLAGWLTAVLAAFAMVVWSMYYVWRRRQYEALIGRLERELSSLRNMPIQHPAPFEDLPELPDPVAARVLSASDRQLEA